MLRHMKRKKHMDQTFTDGVDGWLYVVDVELETFSQADATSEHESDTEEPKASKTLYQHVSDHLVPFNFPSIPHRHSPSLHTYQNPLPPSAYTSKLFATYLPSASKYKTPYKWSFIPLGATYASVVKYAKAPPYSVSEDTCDRYTFVYMCHTLVADVPCGEHGVVMMGVDGMGEEHCVESEPWELKTERCPLCIGYSEKGRKRRRMMMKGRRHLWWRRDRGR